MVVDPFLFLLNYLSGYGGYKLFIVFLQSHANVLSVSPIGRDYTNKRDCYCSQQERCIPIYSYCHKLLSQMFWSIAAIVTFSTPSTPCPSSHCLSIILLVSFCSTSHGLPDLSVETCCHKWIHLFPFVSARLPWFLPWQPFYKSTCVTNPRYLNSITWLTICRQYLWSWHWFFAPQNHLNFCLCYVDFEPSLLRIPANS